MGRPVPFFSSRFTEENRLAPDFGLNLFIPRILFSGAFGKIDPGRRLSLASELRKNLR